MLFKEIEKRKKAFLHLPTYFPFLVLPLLPVDLSFHLVLFQFSLKNSLKHFLYYKPACNGISQLYLKDIFIFKGNFHQNSRLRAFFLQYFKNVILLSGFGSFLYKKLSVNCTIVLLFFPPLLLRFSLYLWFDYYMSRCDFLCIYHACSSLGFLDL